MMHENGENNNGEFSTAEFTARERRRIRKLVRDDDNASIVQRTLLKWLAICAGIFGMVVVLTDKIKVWLKWAFS